MPSSSTPPAQRFSPGLLHQASKGKFSTRSATNRVMPVPPEQISKAQLHKQNVDGKNLAMNDVQMPALSPDRVQYDANRFFSAAPKRQELRITVAAARALTRLFSALCLEPGAGPEVPLDTRKQILDILVRESHALAESVSMAVMGKDKPSKVPVYLRAKLLQQSSEFIANQWVHQGSINTEPLRQIASVAFAGNVNSINQEVVELFHISEEYTEATTQELSQARITSSVIRASWNLLQQVQKIDLRHYDPDIDMKSPAAPFSWGKNAYDVAQDLTKIALSIAKENEIDIDDLDMATTWTQNAVARASMLVKAEYQMLTERALHSSFKDNMLSEARMGQLYTLYDDMLSRVKVRARQNYITVERNAVDAMSATAYTSYLPKRSEQSRSDHDNPEPDKEHKNVSNEPTTHPDDESSKVVRTFRFLRPMASA